MMLLMATLFSGPDRAGAKKEQALAFIHYLQGSEAQGILAKYGLKKI